MSYESNLECKFCGQTFAHKSALNTHNRSAKYCLQLQGKTVPSVQCTHCSKEFANQFQLDAHHQICLVKVKAEYDLRLETQKQDYERKLSAQWDRLEKQKQEYDQKIEQIHKSHHEALIRLAAQRTTISNKNVVNHNNIHISAPLDLSVENIKKVIDQHLTLQVIGDGQVGVANMLHQNLLTDDNGQLLYQCTDASRGHFVHLDKTLQPMKDVKATRLKAALVEAKVGQKAIETVQASIPVDDERFPHYEVKAMEVMAMHTNQDAKFRGQLAAVCVPASDASSTVPDMDDQEDENRMDSDDE